MASTVYEREMRPATQHPPSPDYPHWVYDCLIWHVPYSQLASICGGHSPICPYLPPVDTPMCCGSPTGVSCYYPVYK